MKINMKSKTIVYGELYSGCRRKKRRAILWEKLIRIS
jgi:hypothetical protein